MRDIPKVLLRLQPQLPITSAVRITVQPDQMLIRNPDSWMGKDPSSLAHGKQSKRVRLTDKSHFFLLVKEQI